MKWKKFLMIALGFALFLLAILRCSKSRDKSVFNSKEVRERSVKAGNGAGTETKRLKPPAVILLSQTRSGSSVVGELFNQRTDVSYFYEPLYPFPKHPCDSLWPERVQVLRNFINCNFNNVDLYNQGFEASQQTDRFTQEQSNQICERYASNLQLVDSGLHTEALGSDKYMRIRHEDFSMDPVATARAVYDFVGINMNPAMENFLLQALSSDNPSELSKSDTQGTKRNSAHVVSAWRNNLNFEELKAIQNSKCFGPLKRLGYFNFESAEDLADVKNIKSF